MRLLRLVVTAFKRVRHAELDLGRGLNVLYGPNDLGKSTVATAVYAALLAPPKSPDFQSWYAGDEVAPTLELTFAEEGRQWRVAKTFGTRGRALLESSKDGHSWSRESSGRQVDEQLRALLSWGVRAPGGLGGPRGLPTSFLTHALLAPQHEVEAILRHTLEEDRDGSGRVRLAGALSALAQDPLLKQVLDVAQLESDRFHSPTGRKRFGAGSPFMAVNEEIKSLEDELRALAETLERNAGLEAHAHTLREQRAQATLALDQASASLEHTREAFELGRSRARVEERLQSAREALAQVAGLKEKIGDARAKRDASERQRARAEGEVEQAQRAVQAAQRALEAAHQAQRAAQSPDGDQAREVMRAKLGEQVATYASAIERLGAQRAHALERLAAAAAAATARERVQQLGASLKALQASLAHATATLADKQHDETLAESALAFARWSAACAMQAIAASARAEAKTWRSNAASKEAEARQLELRAQAEDGQRRALPTAPQCQQVRELHRLLELAKASLNGAFRVTVRPNSAITLRTTVDEGAALDEVKLIAERSYEAERRVLLSLGKLVDIEVTGGSAERRAELEALQRRWASEAMPVLQPLGISSAAELEHLVHDDGGRALASQALRDEAAAAGREGQAALQRAEFLERQAAGAPSSEQVAALEGAITLDDRAALQQFVASLGADWEPSLQALHTSARAAVVAARAELVAASSQLAEASWQRDEATRRADEAEARAKALAAGPDTLDPAQLDRSLAELTVRHDEAVRSLAALRQAQGTAGTQHSAAVAEATLALEHAEAAHQQTVQALAAARTAVDTSQGQLEALSAQLDALEVDALEQRLEQAQRDFVKVRHLPATSPDDVALAEDVVQQRRAELDAVSADFHGADGQLRSLGGPSLRDRQRELELALAAARARERHLATDAEAWKLLTETLREVENTQSVHLGSALAAGVSARFTALTGGRYHQLSMASGLATQGVSLRGTQAAGDAVLEGLSVGTRDQLATLIRLAIAQHLGTTLVLDDQLVHTDQHRLGWFAELLRTTAQTAQVLVFTCRPGDYLSQAELSATGAAQSNPGVRALNLATLIDPFPSP